jgi:hypothetical protein
MGLYVLALAIRLVAAGQLPFPATEPSAYYVSVAQNLVQGEGLVSDAVWSFATPPLVTPKPAFELWLPMSSLVSAAGMAVLGPTFWAAQVAGALLGALVAPLAWAIGRASARVAGLDGRREGAVAIAAGLLAAVLGPLVLASVVPDSYMPYLVFTLVAALLVPRVSGVGEGATDALSPPDVVAGLALGVALGLAYLSRQEVIWLGLTVLVMLGWVLRSRPGAGRLREATTRLWPVLLGGLVVVVPWLMRNAIEFGSPFPGQAIENMFFVRNEDVFAFGERPSAARYLEQGAATVLGNPLVAAWDGFLNVLLLPAFPIGLVGLASLVGMRRSPALRRPTALLALLVSGGLTFCATALLFPVATLWGTFMHASGPLVVGLIVVAALGADAFVARISDVRGWQRQNVILGPIALVAVTALLGSLQLSLLSSQSVANGERYAALADSLASVAGLEGGDVPGTLITDHPMWLADALGRQAVALPDEDLASLSELSRRFDAPWVVVIDERGRYPEALLGETARGCLAGEPLALDDDVEPAWLFRLAEGCVTT